MSANGISSDGWTRVPNTVLSADTANLTLAARWVLVLLLAHRNQRTGLAWPSQDSIAQMSGLGRSTVGVSVAALQEAGLITAKLLHHHGQTRLVYSFPCLDRCAASGATPPTDRCAASGATGDVRQIGGRCPASGAALRSQRRIPYKEEQDDEQDDNNSGEDAAGRVVVVEQEDAGKDKEATGKEALVAKAFGTTVALSVRPHLSDLSIANVEGWVAEASKANNPAGMFVRAIQGGWQLPTRNGEASFDETKRAAHIDQRIIDRRTQAASDAAEADQGRDELKKLAGEYLGKPA